MSAPLWLSDSWFKEIVEFRLDWRQFLGKHQLTEENFLLDVLQSLCQDSVSVTVKSHLLELLQEYGSVLHQSLESVEQTVSSLQDIFQQLKKNSPGVFGQCLLTSITSLTLQQDLLHQDPSLFSSVVEVLLDVVCQVNATTAMHTRSTACQCLMEMETCHPGVLSRKLEYLWQLCQLEKTYCCQAYLVLFTTVLKNALRLLVMESQSERLSERVLTDMLCNRTEPLKPFVRPARLVEGDTLQASQKDSSSDVLPAYVSIAELRNCLCTIMEHSSLCTTPMLHYLVRQLMDVVAMATSIPCSLFKTLHLRHEASFDILMQDMVLRLQMQFGQQLFTTREQSEILQRTVLCSQLCCLPVTHRLLLYQLLIYWPDAEGAVPAKPSLPDLLPKTEYRHFFPSVFDNLDIQVGKLRLLVLCFSPGQTPDVFSRSLIGALNTLHKPVSYGIGGRTVTGLYRTLHTYYLRHHATVLAMEINRLLIDLTSRHFGLMPHTLHFITVVEAEVPGCDIATSVLEPLTNDAVSREAETASADLYNRLQLLEMAARYRQLDPQGTLHFLQRLVYGTDVCSTGDWGMGCALLGVCQSLLINHNNKRNFSDIGNLLYSLLMTYADVDIRDRAKFYYALLTNLSAEKLSALLMQAPPGESSQKLTTVVSGSTCFPDSSPVTYNAQSVIKLTRKENGPMAEHEPTEDITHSRTDLLQRYYSALKADSCQQCLHLRYLTQLTAEGTHLQDIYALVLHVESTAKCRPIQDIKLPHLSKESQEPSIIVIPVEPLEPASTTLTMSATFTGSDGKAYTCNLDPIDLKLHDFWLPLTLAQSLCDADKIKLTLDLWEKFTDRTKEGDTQGLESFFLAVLDYSEVEKLLSTTLKDYYMGTVIQDGVAVGLLGVYLAPSSHLIIKVMASVNKATKVAVATDDWKILPLSVSYLQSLLCSTEE